MATNEPRLTKGQAAIISAYTGMLFGKFGDFHEYAEKLMGRPLWTHEFADPKLAELIMQKAKEDFLLINPEPEDD